eukprot:COSAG05_NODE_723_length_7727_cov_19.327871_9_plen_210_part_00
MSRLNAIFHTFQNASLRREWFGQPRFQLTGLFCTLRHGSGSAHSVLRTHSGGDTGIVYACMGRWDAVRDEATKALQLQPRGHYTAAHHMLRGIALHNLGPPALGHDFQADFTGATYHIQQHPCIAWTLKCWDFCFRVVFRDIAAERAGWAGAGAEGTRRLRDEWSLNSMGRMQQGESWEVEVFLNERYRSSDTHSPPGNSCYKLLSIAC